MLPILIFSTIYLEIKTVQHNIFSVYNFNTLNNEALKPTLYSFIFHMLWYIDGYTE